MTNEEAIKRLNKIKAIYKGMDNKSDVKALDMAIKALEHTDGDLISKSVLDQIKWERDVAIEQLKDLGYGFGEKPRTDGDLISRKAVINALHNANISFTVVSTINFKDYQREIQEIVDNIVIAQEKAINELSSAENTAECDNNHDCEHCDWTECPLEVEKESEEEE